MKKIITPYKGRPGRRVQVVFEKPSRTKQAFKDECDVNQILAKYQKTQLLNHVNTVKGSYGDFSNVNDYQSSLNAVMEANQNFMGLPAAIRQKFMNDPSQLISFLSDDSNYEEALKLGLLDRAKSEAFIASKTSSTSSPSPTPSSKANPSPKPSNDD